MTKQERDEQQAFIDSILQECRHLCKIRPCTYADYEHYKQILQSRGIYGFESAISDALKL